MYALFHVTSPYIFLMIVILFGAGGGVSFVSTLTWIAKTKKLSSKSKEFASGIMLLCYDVGRCVGLLLVLLFDHLIMPTAKLQTKL